jgi:hypothetical protein
MDSSRFKGHYILPDRGYSEDVNTLAGILKFNLPQPNYYFNPDASAFESHHWVRSNFLPQTLPNSVVVGIGLGGLLAARLQEEFAYRGLSVIAVNAPLFEGPIAIQSKVQNRVAIYSSLYAPISDRCGWLPYTGQAYDAPWFRNGIKNVKFGLASLIRGYLQNEDIHEDLELFTGTVPDNASKAQGA